MYILGLLYDFMLKLEKMLTIANKLSTNCLKQVTKIQLGQWNWFHCSIDVTTHVLHLLSQPNNGISSIKLEDG
jgi:hypothetical protein